MKQDMMTMSCCIRFLLLLLLFAIFDFEKIFKLKKNIIKLILIFLNVNIIIIFFLLKIMNLLVGNLLFI